MFEPMGALIRKRNNYIVECATGIAENLGFPESKVKMASKYQSFSKRPRFVDYEEVKRSFRCDFCADVLLEPYKLRQPFCDGRLVAMSFERIYLTNRSKYLVGGQIKPGCLEMAGKGQHVDTCAMPVFVNCLLLACWVCYD